MLRHHAVPPPVSDLLIRLAPSPALTGFALAGGTSLALRFGHRWSVDLDFFTTDPFDPERLNEALALLGSTVVEPSVGSLTVAVERIKLDFLRHAYPLLRPVEGFGEIRMLSVPDVAAMKLNDIANRGSKKDFFDLSRLLEIHPLGEMLGFFESRYPNSDLFIVLRSLAWFDDADQEPDPVSLSGITWERVKEIVTTALRSEG